MTAFGNEVASDFDEDQPLARRGGGPGRRRAGGPGGPGKSSRFGFGRRPKRVRRKLPAWIEWPLYLVVTLTITALIKTFFVQMYSIPSESMEPTTYRGDRVIVDQLSTWFGSEPARGEVIVFHDPHHWLDASQVSGAHSSAGFSFAEAFRTAGAFVGVLPDQKDDLLIKRIIGVGGDTVECKTQDGPVYVNGVALNEPYINNHAAPCFNGAFKVTVPMGSLWVLGDNRKHSGDSSYNYLKANNPASDAGYVPRANVVGHVIGVISWLEDARTPDPDAPCQAGKICAPGAEQYPGVVTSKTP